MKAISDNPLRIVIPPKSSIEHHIIAFHHAIGHPGQRKLQLILQRTFYIKDLKKKVAKFINGCHICAIVKTNKTSPPKGQSEMPLAKRPFQIISIDYAKMVNSSRNNSSLLIVVDRFSKLVTVFPVKQETAEYTVKCLELYFIMYAKPEAILSDNAPIFYSQHYVQFLETNEVKIHHSTAYVSQTNGQAESQIRRIRQNLNCLLIHFDIPDRNWDDVIQLAADLLNHEPHKNLPDNLTPKLVALNVSPPSAIRIPNELLSVVEPNDLHDFVERRRKDLVAKSEKKLEANLLKKPTKIFSCPPGTIVYVKNLKNKNNLSNEIKFQPKYLNSLFVVIHEYKDSILAQDLYGKYYTNKSVKFHKSDVKLFHERTEMFETLEDKFFAPMGDPLTISTAKNFKVDDDPIIPDVFNDAPRLKSTPTKLNSLTKTHDENIYYMDNYTQTNDSPVQLSEIDEYDADQSEADEIPNEYDSPIDVTKEATRSPANTTDDQIQPDISNVVPNLEINDNTRSKRQLKTPRKYASFYNRLPLFSRRRK